MAKGIEYGSGNAAVTAMPGSDLYKALVAGDTKRAAALNKERIAREREYLARADQVNRRAITGAYKPVEIDCDPQVNFQLGV